MLRLSRRAGLPQRLLPGLKRVLVRALGLAQLVVTQTVLGRKATVPVHCLSLPIRLLTLTLTEIGS